MYSPEAELDMEINECKGFHGQSQYFEYVFWNGTV